MVGLLRKAGYDATFVRVETAEQMKDALAAGNWQIILADYNLPQFNAPEALALLQQSGLDIPFIIVSGGIGEDIAVASMKAGAHDYLMKGALARLAPAVERELREAEVRRARRQAEASLRESELRYRQLWETATDAVLLMDDQGRINFANPAVEKVFGYPAATVIGQPVQMFDMRIVVGRFTLPLTLDLIREFIRAENRAIEGTCHRADKSEAILGLSFNAMELQGKQWLVGFIRDITERKKAEEELRANQEQFRVAREIQQRLFPKESPHLPAFDIAGATRPAEETGGDYFDYLPMQGGCLGIVVGDVTGHGIGPALLMAEARAYLRLLALNRDDVGEILTRANRVLASDVDYEHYITLILGKIDPVKRTLAFANAGHSTGFLLGADGSVRAQMKRGGIPLGLQADNQYSCQEVFHLVSGDIAVFLTDGLEEAMNSKEEFFGVERVLEKIRTNRDKPASEIISGLFKALEDFTGTEEQQDDLTVVVVKVT